MGGHQENVEKVTRAVAQEARDYVEAAYALAAKTLDENNGDLGQARAALNRQLEGHHGAGLEPMDQPTRRLSAAGYRTVDAALSLLNGGEVGK